MIVLEGKVWKSSTSKYWLIYVPLLDLRTEGTSKKDAIDMLEDAIKMLVHKKGFKAHMDFINEGKFIIGANDQKAWVALFLQRARAKQGLTIEEVAHRMGATSKTAYARYEQGETMPSIEKFSEILNAIFPGEAPLLKLAA
ncbi:MAG: helix-turn-helix transcriptional regulator [Deltaproteobacteria bacterium]|nr:helix-turn-helix transcriptional regulator [Deltaproteobacteria bacterium]